MSNTNCFGCHNSFPSHELCKIFQHCQTCNLDLYLKDNQGNFPTTIGIPFNEDSYPDDFAIDEEYARAMSGEEYDSNDDENIVSAQIIDDDDNGDNKHEDEEDEEDNKLNFRCVKCSSWCPLNELQALTPLQTFKALLYDIPLCEHCFKISNYRKDKLEEFINHHYGKPMLHNGRFGNRLIVMNGNGKRLTFK